MHTGKGYTYIDNRSRASCSHWAVFSLMQLGDMLFNGAAPNSIGAPPCTHLRYRLRGPGIHGIGYLSGLILSLSVFSIHDA